MSSEESSTQKSTLDDTGRNLSHLKGVGKSSQRKYNFVTENLDKKKFRTLNFFQYLRLIYFGQLGS